MDMSPGDKIKPGDIILILKQTRLLEYESIEEGTIIDLVVKGAQKI